MAELAPDEAGYRRLRAEIVSGRLGPNQRLVEAELSLTFGMGRDAVRMALVRLEQEGLVERERYRGARVRRVDLDEALREKGSDPLRQTSPFLLQCWRQGV